MSIKIGIVGCGGIAGAHMSRLAQLKEVEFTGMCDIDKGKAEKASATYGGKVYTDFREMFDERNLDACFICVPPFAHTGQEEACIERSIPFFVEKPLHLDLKKAEGIAEKLKLAGLITSVGYVLRYYDIVEMAKDTLAKEQIAVALGRYYGGVPGAGEGWYSKKSLSGGQLIEQSTHTVDMMRCLVGDVEEVFAYRFEGINKKIYRQYDVEDASATLVRFKNGCIGNLTCTWLWNGFNSGVDIIGKGIMLNFSGNSLTIDRGDKKIIHISSIDPMLEEDTAFIKSVMENDRSYIKSDYVDALKSLKVSFASYESMQTGKPVKL